MSIWARFFVVLFVCFLIWFHVCHFQCTAIKRDAKPAGEAIGGGGMAVGIWSWKPLVESVTSSLPPFLFILTTLPIL